MFELQHNLNKNFEVKITLNKWEFEFTVFELTKHFKHKMI